MQKQREPPAPIQRRPVRHDHRSWLPDCPPDDGDIQRIALPREMDVPEQSIDSLQRCRHAQRIGPRSRQLHQRPAPPRHQRAERTEQGRTSAAMQSHKDIAKATAQSSDGVRGEASSVLPT
jgi:hypothetical protein